MTGSGPRGPDVALLLSLFGTSFALILLELVLTRVFAVVLFASFAHLALALALTGMAFGALAQHLWPSLVPDQGLERRVAWLGVYLSGTSILAVLATIVLPVTVQFAEPPVTYGERSSVMGDLVDPRWFAALLPVLAAPFALGGLLFAGVFERRRSRIGPLYAADLIGGAAGALVFVPLLGAVAGPDAVFAVALAALVPAAALFTATRDAIGQVTAAGGSVAALAALFLAGDGAGLLKVRYAAGYSEVNVTWVKWTPLTRLAVHEDQRGIYLLLDNTSASEVVLTRPRRIAKAKEANRSAVYQIHDPDARVAILAASAGPEVAVAQHFGFHTIDAIDIAPEIGDAVAERFPGPLNPYLAPGVRRITLDGRAAIDHADAPYDVIQMVHANLHSSAGLLSNAWSPALLETREAFATYLDHLTPDGTLCFARGAGTPDVGPAMIGALADRGVADARGHVMWIGGDSSALLAKRRPFTDAECAAVASWLDRIGGHHLTWDPCDPDPAAWKQLATGPILTDAHPWFDTPGGVVRGLIAGLTDLNRSGEQVAPQQVVYRTLALQAVFSALCGLLLVALPPFVRRESLPTGFGPVIGYAACLGYGYLAVETVLIHELVLFVGHPTYAITAVILAMLLSSGVGSALAQRVAPDRLAATLRAGLFAILVLGAVQAWLIPPLLRATALGLPLGVRVALTVALLSPLGLVMGLPFPLGMRLLRDEAGSLVPWVWSVNGWTSVVAALATVLLARGSGYPTAFAAALAAYAVAFALVGRLDRAGLQPGRTP